MYPVFLDAGYIPSLFWELSIGEVSDLLESFARRKEGEQKRREADLKDVVMLLFNQAAQTANMVGRLLDKDVPVKSPRDYYPELFGQEGGQGSQGQDCAREGKAQWELELHKARMDDFAFRHNSAIKRAREGGVGSGRDDAGEAAGHHRGTDESLL